MSTEECEELISVLPLSTVEYAFAYGSGAFQQQGENKSEKMVDFVLCTNDPVTFHTENIEKNSSHYSLLRCIGAKSLVKFQTRLAARVYYNTRVHVGNRRMKYGVISMEDLKRDLLDWRWLYVAGRLHKPVLNVVTPTAAVKSNLEENRRSALQAALLLLPDSFNLEELFEKIVSLSYTGDFRMYVGEDKDKIKKIVLGSMEELSDVYNPLLANDSRLVVQNGKVLQDGSTAAIYHRLNLLPSTVLNRIQKNWNKRNKWQKDTEEARNNQN
ncbi:Phosphatidate cytidylyltransferase mitochondrial [Trichostrongylus colubriformis]|uniref:Phosphatidate cytidylyltransferase, mitochondrial n=1 Tax=Trichostrongylus colubriformis TaxID=6319 RepID=A0AAN8EU23_TRICO